MAVAVAVRFDFIDNKGKTSFTKVRVPVSFTIAQYVEFAQAMGQLLANISGCRVTNASLSFDIDLSGLGLKVAASAISDVYQKARMQFNSAIAGIRAFFRLPTFDEALVVSGSDAINTADPDVAALIAAYTSGIVVTGGTVSPTDARGNDISSIQFAREIHRKKL